MKIVLTVSFFLLLLMSCNNEKEETYPSTDIKVDTTDNIEDKTIHLRYKDSSTMTISHVNILTKEMQYHSFTRKLFDSSRTSYRQRRHWTDRKDSDSSYYYSENIVTQHSNEYSTIETNNRVRLISKNKISYQKKLELLAWPMNELMFISTKKDSVIRGRYTSDSISY